MILFIVSLEKQIIYFYVDEDISLKNFLRYYSN